MIRRGFWIAVGMAGGIMGYRRAAALGRRASGMLAGTSGLPGGSKLTGGGQPADRSKLAGGSRLTRPGGPAGRAGLGSRRKRHVAREAFRFTRDVRDGMELYIARHPRPSGSTLSRHTDHDDEKDGR